MVHFASNTAFLLLIPLFAIAAYVWIQRKKLVGSLQYSSLKLFTSLKASIRAKLSFLPLLIRVGAIVFMIVALARPQTANTKTKKNVEGIDIILLVDLSLTMLIEDMHPHNRLEAAKVAQIEFVKNRPNDRIGIVAFSGEAFTAVPPTLDHKVVIEKLNELQQSERIKQGTAQGVAIATGVARLKDSTAKSRIMVFITDGENNTGTIDPATALDIAKGFGIKIYTVGVGSDGEKQLPVITTDAFGRKVTRYQPMTTTFHEDAMMKIASETGGQYWRSENMKELREVYATIDRLEKTKIDSNTYTRYTELFPFYVKWALALFLLSWLLSQTVLRRQPAA